MKKKLLGQHPLKLLKIDKEWKERTLIVAEIIDVKEEILVINIYKNLNDKEESIPEYRTFLSKTDFATEITATNVWNSKKISSVINGYKSYLNERGIRIVSGLNHIETFCENRYEWTKGLGLVERHQDAITYTRQDKTYRSRCERIDSTMKEVDELGIPEDFETLCTNRIHKYGYYEGKKVKTVHCTSCGTSYESKETPKHNYGGVCEICSCSITYKSTGRTKVMEEHENFVLMQKYKDGFVSRYFRCNYKSYKGRYSYNIQEQGRILYDSKEFKTFYNVEKSYSTRKWWDCNTDSVIFGHGTLYRKGLDKVLKGTVYQYSQLDLIACIPTMKYMSHKEFIEKFNKNSYIEYLIKMGLYSLTVDVVNRYSLSCINKTGKTIMEILKINREQLKRLVSFNGGYHMVELLQLESEYNFKLSDEQLRFLMECKIPVSDIKRLMEYAKINKIIKFISIQNTKDIKNMVLDWIDYLKNCKKLEMDITNEFVLFPRRLKESHDNITKLVLEKQKAVEEAHYQKIIDKMKAYEYESKELKILVPSTTVDIVIEGQKLHHCVGTYVNQVVKEQTMIFFVRLKAKEEEPYYTMEIKENKVIQVRGKNNCAMTKEVSKFIDRFKKVKLQKLLKEAV